MYGASTATYGTWFAANSGQFKGVFTAQHVFAPFLVPGSAEIPPWATIRLTSFYAHQTFGASLRWISDMYDLAALAAEETIPTIRWGNFESLQIGDPLLIVGASDVEGVDAVVMDAVLLDKHIFAPGLFQFDAEVFPGCSGGPVLNLKGEVVGMVIIRQKWGDQTLGVGLCSEALIYALQGQVYTPPPTLVASEHVLLPTAIAVGAAIMLSKLFGSFARR